MGILLFVMSKKGIIDHEFAPVKRKIYEFQSLVVI